jgi:nicotinamidase-related amidase
MAEPVGKPEVVTYDVDPETTALVGVDFQRGFGHGFEPVPHADTAVANFIALARAWRAAGGTVLHVHTTYTTQRAPTGRITDFVPGIADALSEGSPMAAFYEGMVEEGDVLVPKTTFSAVLSSDLGAELARRGLDTAVVGGLTTPICVQTTVDALSMTGTKVCLVADACASQPIGSLTAEEAHDAAVQRMGYLFASVTTTAALIEAIGAPAAAGVRPPTS